MSEYEFQIDDISFEEDVRERKNQKPPVKRDRKKADSEEKLKEDKNENGGIVEKGQDLALNAFTGLVMSSGRTQFPVQHAFLMQGDFTVFITMDEEQKIYIEPFSVVEDVEPICELMELCDSSQFQSVKMVADPNRQIITVILFNQLPTARYNSDLSEHSLAGFVIDFRAFSPDASQQDIQIREIDTTAIISQLGVKEIKQMYILFNNVTPYTYDFELLLLIDSFDAKKAQKDQFFELFGALNINNDETKGIIEAYYKELKQPLQQREAALISIFKMGKTLNLIVFEDGFVCQWKNDRDEGVVKFWQLKTPFGKVNQAILEEDTCTLILQTQEQERSFYQYSRDQWTGIADQSRNKFKFMSLFGKFVIAQNLDKYTYLIELTPEKEIMLQFKLGEEDTWDFTFDADEKFSQFLLQYQQNGKNFFWWKYDKENQFHLSKIKTLEQVCGGIIIRVSKEKAKIEIKQDMQRFEDPFYDFQTMEFSGLPIIVTSFTPYRIPGKAGLIFLCITPDPAPKIPSMYFVLVDVQNVKAQQSTVNLQAEPWNFTGVFFFNETRFIGERNISPTQIEFCEYEILIQNGFEIVRNDHLLCMTGVGLKAVCFDSKKNSLLFMQQQLLSEKDEFLIYSLNLTKYLNPSVTRKPVYINIPILDVLEIVAKLDVFTNPISVFTREDILWASATFDPKGRIFYAIVSNPALTLLYNVNMNNEKKQNMKVRFSQIVTITSATNLMQPNSLQLLAISKNSACVFRIDKGECSDIDQLFEEGNEQKQCKRLVGKNIDLKVEFDSKIQGVTCCDSIITMIFGDRSIMLELDEKVQQELRNEDGELEFYYEKCINSLNDLAKMFKQILYHYYTTDGYIKITEDQGNWDSRDSFMPVTLMNADFVTLIQDDDGNQGSDESSLVKYVYQNNYNIWESIFRDAMASEKMEITYEQLRRFLTPVITNHNNNLLFNICYNQEAKLENILSMPGFEDYYIKEKKMFPIYFNFFGQSQIQLALRAHDNKSFYKLLDIFIKMQSGVESSYLVNSWLLGAISQGLDIVALLDSPTLQVVCDASIIEHISTWPGFHTDTEQQSENYEKTFTEMMHDETAYFTLFGNKFVEQEAETKHLLDQKLHEQSKDGSRDSLYPIKYYAEKLACDAKTPEEQLSAVFELLEILSETEQMNYFRCGFILRLIEFQWNGPLVKYYNVVSGCYIFSFLLIAVASIMLHWMELKPMKSSLARITLLGINMVVLCVSLCTFELKSFLIDKLGYFQSFWNWNDILLFVFSGLTLFQEIRALVKGNILELSNIDVLEEEDSDTAETLLRILKKKKKKGGAGEVTNDFDPSDYYDTEPWQQWMRVSYCLLCLHISIKVLSVAQFNENIAFLVKILSKVFQNLLPFFLLWFAIQFMFGLAINALDLIFWNADSLHQEGDYYGYGKMFGAIFLYVFRASIGDFQPDVFKFLPKPQLIAMWLYFIMLVMISVVVFCNMVVALINEVYQEVIETRIEEALQKRCGILCELANIFGKITPPKATNIVVTRVSQDNCERPEQDTNMTVKVIQQVLVRERLHFNEKILTTRKDLVAQSEKNIQRLEGAKALLDQIQDLISQQEEQGRQFGNITVKTVAQTVQLEEPARPKLEKHKTPTMTELDQLLADEDEFQSRSEFESESYY